MSKKQRKKNLYKKNPYCYWCGIFMIFPTNMDEGNLPNAATLDHLNNRLFSKTRKINIEYNEQTVLACKKCNNERHKDESILNRDLMNQKSNCYILGHYPFDGIYKSLVKNLTKKKFFT